MPESKFCHVQEQDYWEKSDPWFGGSMYAPISMHRNSTDPVAVLVYRGTGDKYWGTGTVGTKYTDWYYLKSARSFYSYYYDIYDTSNVSSQRSNSNFC